jgi:SAM-dependent methyltransferase
MRDQPPAEKPGVWGAPNGWASKPSGGSSRSSAVRPPRRRRARVALAASLPCAASPWCSRMADLPPRLFDRALLRARAARAARSGEAGSNFLVARAADEAAWRLSAILRRFPRAVDLRARRGEFARALSDAGAAGQVDAMVEMDLTVPPPGSPRAGPRLVGDAERLPFAPERFDLAVSLLSLHWANDLVGALVQIRRVLRPDGLFLGAIFGGDTLHELRACLLEAEAEVHGGAGPRVSPFADARDATGLLQRAGFALPVGDVDRITVRYDHPLKLMADLRAMGETNALVERPRRPLSRPVLARMCELYQTRHAGPDGRVSATFEIVSLTGWAPHESQQQPLKPGSAKARLADALGVVERRLPRA